jgi:hypothetical protein
MIDCSERAIASEFGRGDRIEAKNALQPSIPLWEMISSKRRLQ